MLFRILGVVVAIVSICVSAYFSIRLNHIRKACGIFDSHALCACLIGGTSLPLVSLWCLFSKYSSFHEHYIAGFVVVCLVGFFFPGLLCLAVHRFESDDNVSGISEKDAILLKKYGLD